ncbi:DnaJ-domain-containing protein [Daedalea quercina L-15889]|uniref:DnaJ-domain-containing protein n=1 Tax=Daedalea quercina L-15889 TaxID=1314783 RepID=A0A165QLE7_9APHY|nr:DnaJ-domain-containing protein [Daedalea quercina L-15889]
MLTAILSLIGWSYLPHLATSKLLPIFHQFYPALSGRPAPPPNTPPYFRHYRYVYAVTVISYLLYNFRQAALSMPPNYYELLGVDPNADENGLKVAFRQFARRYHPDRVGPQGEALFINVRDAFEALKNPTTRFAYDRFGPEALHWSQCTTLREYVRQGLMQSAGFYIVSACALLLFSSIGKPNDIAFWRYLLFAAMFAYELKYILGPSPSSPELFSSVFLSEPGSASYAGVLAMLWPRRVAWQHVRFLHSLFVFSSAALSQVAPVLFSSSREGFNLARMQALLQRISYMTSMINRDATQQIHTELHSVHGPETGTQPTNGLFAMPTACEQPADAVVDMLTKEMERMVIEGQLADGGPLQRAVDNAVGRRRRAREEKTQLQVKPAMKRTETGMLSPTPSPPPEGNRTPARRLPSAAFKMAKAAVGTPLGYVRGRSQSL